MSVSNIVRFFTIGGVCLAMTACHGTMPTKNAYWQRVDVSSALYLTGPKAEQQLDQDIAGCVREIDELVKLEALRETVPPDTNHAYHSALNASGDLSHWETPTRAGKNKVDHSDYYDFESCMRNDGWERVTYVRYQSARKAVYTHQATQEIRKYGVSGSAAKLIRDKREKSESNNYNNLND